MLQIFTTLFSLHLATIPLFQPPADWEPALPKNHSPFLQVAFLGKGDSLLRPSINLAIEGIDSTEKEYIKAVKAIYLAEPDTTWRDLGKFSTQAGMGRLTEIAKKLPTGEIKILQLIVIRDAKAYILTGAAAKSDYLQEQSRFFQIFRSFSLPENLFVPLPAEAQERFKTLFAHLGTIAEEDRSTEIEHLQKMIAEYTPQLGKHWELLMLREGLTAMTQAP